MSLIDEIARYRKMPRKQFEDEVEQFKNGLTPAEKLRYER